MGPSRKHKGKPHVDHQDHSHEGIIIAQGTLDIGHDQMGDNAATQMTTTSSELVISMI